jgi:hypothetical protein
MKWVSYKQQGNMANCDVQISKPNVFHQFKTAWKKYIYSFLSSKVKF